MIAKSYLFAAVTSGLLLLFVVPLLGDPTLSPTEIASIVTLTVISAAIAGLVAESYSIMKRGQSEQVSLANAKKYFTCFTCSLLFLAIVAPSIRSTVDSAGMLEVSSAVVLLVLSLALGGLTAEGFFALIMKSRARAQVSGNNAPTVEGARMQGSTIRRSEDQDAIAHFDSGLNALGLTLESKMQEVKEDLVSLIHAVGSTLQTSNEITSGEDNESNASQIKQKMLIQSVPRAKDQVVDVLLGKAKVGGK